MSKQPYTDTCIHCNSKIARVRTPTGQPRFAWVTRTGFYCPKSGEAGWHYPKAKKEAPNV